MIRGACRLDSTASTERNTLPFIVPEQNCYDFWSYPLRVAIFPKEPGWKGSTKTGNYFGSDLFGDYLRRSNTGAIDGDYTQ